MAADINFDRLERELEQALKADQRYWEKNDAKFRAVNQRVATYEEFREIVNASHLKPLSKGERLGDMRANESGLWNRGASASGGPELGSSAVSQASPDPSVVDPPSTCQQFVRHWRSLKSQESQAAFLLSLAPGVFAAIFATEVPFGMLGQFVCALEVGLTQEVARQVADILWALAKCQRLRLAVAFFSQDERLAAGRLMERLVTLTAQPIEGAAVAASDSGGGPCDLAKLKQLYLGS